MSFYEPDSLARAAGGRWLRPPPGGTAPVGVGTDTRADLDRRLFIAIAGDRHDGHDHVAAAVAAGAPAVMVHRAAAAEAVPPGAGVLVVDDTRRALGRLAAAYRRSLAGTTVVAVTGSCGKTTVKHLLHHVLSVTHRGSAAPRSFNNEIGLPLTILAARPDDEYLVLEMGANHPGEIDALARIAEPDIGVITMVGRAHLEGFGSVDNVAREKAALLRHLRPGGLGVVNADQPVLRRYAAPQESVVLFGEAHDADLRLSARGACDGPGGGWWIEVNRRARFGLGLPGRHNAVNALAVIAVGRRLGLYDLSLDRALASCPPVPMRLSRHEFGDVTVFNDAYNANPDSMTASLESFADLAAGARRRVVVLGDMLELGDEAAEHHREVGRRVLELDRRLTVDRLVLVGPMAGYIAEPINGAWHGDRVVRVPVLDGEAAARVAALLAPGDAVLLKGSRAMRLECLLEALGAAHS